MKTTINKLFFAFFLFTVTLVSADVPPSPPPINPGGGSTGGSGSGQLASPIDMYVLGLSIIAFIFIMLYTKKYRSQKI